MGIKLYQAVLIYLGGVLSTSIFITPVLLVMYFGFSIEQIYFWIFMGIIFILLSFVYANLIYLFPKEGGVYEYATYINKHLGFAVGWLEYIGILLALSFWLHISVSLLSTIFNKNFGIIGIFVLLIAFLISILGKKTSNKFIIFLSLFNLVLVILLFLYAIYLYLNLDYIQIEINIRNILNILKNQKLKVLLASILEIFAGTEILGFFANNKNKKILRKATIIGSIIVFFIVITLIFLITITILNKGSFYELTKTGLFIFLMGSMMTIGNSLIWIIGGSNMLHEMGLNKQLPSIFSKTTKGGVPVYSILFTVIFAAFFYIFGIYDILINNYFVASIFIYITSTLAFIKTILEKEKRNIKTYINLFVSYLLIIILLFITLIYKLEIFVLLLITILGVSLYLSREFQRNKKIIKIFHDLFAPIVDIFYYLLLKEDLPIIEKLLGNLDKKIILDFGSSTGHLSTYFAKKYDCFVYSSEISKKSLDILKKKALKGKIFNIVPILDKPDSIDPGFKSFFDVVIAYHTLSLIKDYNKFIEGLKRSLKTGGIFLAIVYDRIFKIFEVPEWIKNIDIILKENGFDVIVIRKKGLLWDKVIIYAKSVSPALFTNQGPESSS